MLNTLSARATFYDIIGYFVPGMLILGIVCLWMHILGGNPILRIVLSFASKHVFMTSIIGVVLCYVAGHCVNAISSALLEKCLYKDDFTCERNWYGRMCERQPDRAYVVQKIVNQEFKMDHAFDVNQLTTFDLLIRMEEYFPQSTMSGFSFLCFYGMSRTLALLSWVASLPVGIYCGVNWSGELLAKISFGVATGILIFAIGFVFVRQYLRFVRYYNDFLGSTLMFPAKKSKL